MKSGKFIFFIFFIIPLIIFFRISFLDRQREIKRFNTQLGRYIIDIEKTNLGPYTKDSNLFKALMVTFNPDSTFIFNMKVPFILDSVGRWNTGGTGVEDWNYLYYKGWGYSNYKENVGDQFGQCCLADSTFKINSVTPRLLKPQVPIIVFKKLNPKSTDLEW